MHQPVPLALFAVLALTAPTALATALLLGDVARGKTLHQQNCAGCHDTSVYTRAQRRVRTVEGLIGQVRMCNTNLKTNLSDKQMEDLVVFLNETYYKFE